MKINQLSSIFLLVVAYIIFSLYIYYSALIDLYTIGIISITILITSLIVLFLQEKTLLSFNIIFLSMIYIFHLSHVVLIVMGIDRVLGYDQRFYTTEYYYLQAVIYSIHIYFWMSIGMIVNNFRNKSKIIAINNTNSRRLLYTGIILAIVGIIPRLYIDVSKIILYIQGNYNYTRSFITSGLIVIMAKVFYIGLLTVMISLKRNKPMAKAILFGVIIYNILYMITGSRGESVIVILLFFFSYYTIIDKLKVKKIILLVFFGYFLLGVLSFIAETRNILDRDLDFMLKTFISHLTSESPILRVLAELGVSIKTVFYSIEFIPSVKNHTYGLNYLESIVVILPNITGFIYNKVQDLTFIYNFPNHEIMGGSLVGEIYYSFGKLGFIFAFTIGFISSSLNRIYRMSIKSQRYIQSIITLLIFSSALWWVRDYFYVMIREISWITILLLVVYKTFSINRISIIHSVR
ncbi:O-antigen polymerase [Paracholeplasma manati]|uniref:O-antigen polymerase n=1 Tax=Paracholeplasma manati TaxID=591373 RepID=UPI0024088884|nr:O-antigen polymerase [Paracholeplasma manati]MDG0888951.1 O-antigen ligase [Paracholeplasma manati]